MKLTLSSYEFLQRTEDCFRALHDRVSYLEERQARNGPSDEQVERVLRKILAEKFTHDALHRTDSLDMAKSSDFFIENARNRSTIRPITINAASLLVEPDSVPSNAYAETFQMLEGRLAEYPRMCQEEPGDESAMEGKIKVEYERSIL
jgi:hypothetical protein